ncbi:MAG: DUF3298 and DUF4163 domain-containing protein [Thaumarchaeota archaeon]|nr:DUF3298 and DUF4163 domain-containing protein [Nitrososphaerota archaeon]
MRQFEPLVREYESIEIPEDLESIVNRTISNYERRRKRNWKITTFAACAAAVAALFVGTVNFSPVAASTLSRIPALRPVVQLVTIKELFYKSDTREADVKIPQVEGLDNSQLAKSLNKKYIAQGTELYNKFLQGIGEDKVSPMTLALFTNYKIKTNTKDMLVVERTNTEIAASGTESVTYDNIDLKNQVIITLPSLFKDDSYIDAISENIKTQMGEKTNLADGIMFFIEGDGSAGGFSRITPEQNFYINSDSKLVIVFNECEVAPCSMGIVEFVIPTEVIQTILVSNTYIK